jgi:hypothetical protein
MLAYLPDAFVDSYLRSVDLVRHTSKTLTGIDELKAMYRKVREDGVSIAVGQMDESILGFGAPVFDASGTIAGVVIISSVVSPRARKIGRAGRRGARGGPRDFGPARPSGHGRLARSCQDRQPGAAPRGALTHVPRSYYRTHEHIYEQSFVRLHRRPLMSDGEAMRFDLVIRNGTVIDGTGAPRFGADVAISDGRIAAIGTIEGEAARRSTRAG